MSVESEEVPVRRRNNIDYKAIAMIAGISVVIYLHGIFPTGVKLMDEPGIAYALGSAGASIMAFVVSKRYKGSTVFGKAYFALGIAYSLAFVGQVGWDYQEIVLQEYPYPSVFDVFNFGFYPFVIYHLAKNTLYFKRKFGAASKIWLLALPVALAMVYTYLSSGMYGFDYYFGLLFIAGSAISLSFALLGAKVFFRSLIGAAWVLLAVAIAVSTFADVIYYSIEATGVYEQTGVAYPLWVGSQMTIIYALFKHRKTI